MSHTTLCPFKTVAKQKKSQRKNRPNFTPTDCQQRNWTWVVVFLILFSQYVIFFIFYKSIGPQWIGKIFNGLSLPTVCETQGWRAVSWNMTQCWTRQGDPHLQTASSCTKPRGMLPEIWTLDLFLRNLAPQLGQFPQVWNFLKEWFPYQES